MMYRLALCILAALLVGLAACKQSEPVEEEPVPTPTDVDNPFAEEAPEPEDIVSATGTVRYIDLEGGFFGIVARDGTKYLPRNLEDALREDGQEVRFRAKRLRDVVTMQQWGQPIEILKIEPITVLDDE